MNSNERIQKLLRSAGLSINGPAATDIQVHDPRVYDRVLRSGSLGAGESYMDGWWDAKDLAGAFEKIMRTDLKEGLGKDLRILWYIFRVRFLNLQSMRRAFEVGEKHYDIGNDLYERMLGKSMVYSCGYWSGPDPARDLDEAQEQKMDLICRKIGLKAGETVLDIGCGWGSFAKFAAEKYGARVTGVTISKEQAESAAARTKGSADIFPNGILPSVAQIGRSIDDLFILEDWHNFGADYDKTLVAWCENFERAWPELKEKYGERFYRMWRYYLLSLAGGFRARHNQLWQIILSKEGVQGGYKTVR